MNKIAWKFPPNHGGVNTGFNDGAIDHFKGHPLSSTVREVIQNSLDADRIDEKAPARVCFKIHRISKDDASEVTGIKKHLEACLQRAEAQQLEAAEIFYRKAISRVETSDEIPFLAIHDYNTRGLTGELNGDVGAWAALVKGAGISQKGMGSLGSFGHGSKAPFTLSDIRTVFYLSYVSEEGKNNIERRFQGKSILQTHVDPDNEETTQPTGYFGWTHNCAALKDDQIPEWATKMREDVGGVSGTSLLIPYFMLGEGELPETAITVIANYYYAVAMGNLEVEICGEASLTKETIKEKYWEYLERLDEERDFIDADRIKDNFESLIAVVDPDDHGTQEVRDLDGFSWFIKILENQDEKRTRVAIARRDGMLIRHHPKKLERFPRCKSFEMFVCVDGKRGSQLLKSVENPRHDDFEFDRLDLADRPEALKKYGKLAEKIRERVNICAALPVEEEMADETLDWLSLASSDNKPGEGAERSSVVTVAKGSKVNSNSKNPLHGPSPDGDSTTMSGQGHRGGKGKKKTTGGPFSGPGTGSVVGPGKPTKEKSKKIELTNLRRVHTGHDSGKTKIIFDNPSSGTHQIFIEKIGDDGSTQAVRLLSPDGTESDSVTVQLTEAPRQSINLASVEDLKAYALVAKYLEEPIEENAS